MSAQVQLQMRQNVEELQDFLSDLASWEKDIKQKDEKLRKGVTADAAAVPPVRGSKPVVRTSAAAPVAKPSKPSKQKDKAQAIRPKNYMSYGEWDKFDADKALEDASSESDATAEEVSIPSPPAVPQAPPQQVATERTQKASTSATNSSQAEAEKEKGNTLFKEGKFVEAIAAYTDSLRLYPENAIVHANRSMALIKLERWVEAEADASASIALDVGYVKAYVRRATARAALGNYMAAVHDFQKALELDPPNKDAKDGLARARERLLEQEKSAVAKESAPVRRKRMVIREVDNDSTTEAASSASATGPSTEPSTLPVSNGSRAVEKKITPIATVASPASPSTERASKAVPSPVDKKISPILTAPAPTSPSTEQTSKPTPSGARSSAGGVTKPAAGPSAPKPAQTALKAPTSATEFERTWNQLKTPESRAQYLQLVPVDTFPKVLKEFLDGDLISCIVEVLVQCFAGELAGQALDILEALSKCPRFKTAVSFLSKGERAAISGLIGTVEGQSPDRVATLRRLYS